MYKDNRTEKEKLLYALTGTEKPIHLTEREECMINKFLELQTQKGESNKESIQELVTALDGMVKCVNRLTNDTGSYQTAWVSEFTAPARNALHKYKT